MKRDYYVVDAFTSARFAGNPAAVVLDANGLEDEEMQLIAAEFNLSETTFVLPPTAPGASVRFRWFTPAMEVSMCGHATIAGVHALIESGRLAARELGESTAVRIDTRSGVLTSFVETVAETNMDRVIWLDLPQPTLLEKPLPSDELTSVLRIPLDALEPAIPTVASQDDDALVFVKDFATLNDAKPDFGRLGELQQRHGMRGLCLATVKTVTPSINVQSRFFAPAAGVDEDPVTGSVHGPLAAHLVNLGLVPVHDGTAGLQCVQSKAGGRAGLVWALVQPNGDGRCDVRIGGQAVTTMTGQLVA